MIGSGPSQRLSATTQHNSTQHNTASGDSAKSQQLDGGKVGKPVGKEGENKLEGRAAHVSSRGTVVYRKSAPRLLAG